VQAGSERPALQGVTPAFERDHGNRAAAALRQELRRGRKARGVRLELQADSKIAAFGIDDADVAPQVERKRGEVFIVAEHIHVPEAPASDRFGNVLLRDQRPVRREPVGQEQR
jgi:hypothetical protein